jgi:hypothetical protein
MPVATVETLKKREAQIKKKLAEKAGSMDVRRKRATKKRLRRAQRKRRLLTAVAARRAPKAAPAAEDKAEPAAG